MTFKINIENGISLYTSDELISYAHSGCLYAGNVDLSEFVEKILDNRDKDHYCVSEQEVRDEEMPYKGYDEAVNDIHNYLESM